MAPRLRFAAPTLAVTGLALLAAACSDTTGLPRATLANTVDTVSLFALGGTPIAAPSAFRLDGRDPVRTDQTPQFDFVFDFDSVTEQPVLLPTQVVGLGRLSGLQRATTVFDSIKVAPTGGWVFDSAFVADSGAVLLVRSRPMKCLTGLLSLYAKLEVLAVDPTARRLDFRILVDENCGYRGLELGIPKR